MTHCWTSLESPVGEVLIGSDGDAVTAISFASEPPADSERADDQPVLADARKQLVAYFARERTGFDLPLRLRGTPFQLRVWEALREIPYGTTVGYGAIAGRLGMSRGSARAVGLANATNPVAIVVPCHRVIGSNGKLVGYAGGLDRKRTLLALERDGLF
jgi:methylated-DNA-[protein]-cysteine S-methyltransferase